MSEQPDMPEKDDDFLAAELALGLAEGEAARAGQDRVLRDHGFAQRVAGWHERLVTLTEDIAPVQPPKRLRRKLMAQLFPRTRVPLMQRLWVWQGLTLASLVLLAYVALPQLRPPAPATPVYATRLIGEQDPLQVLAVLDPARGEIALQRLAGAAPAGRVLELWAILPDSAPVSLGVLPTEDATRLALPPALGAQVGQITLAISDEPPGGAPDGAPTGNIMALGPVSEL